MYYVLSLIFGTFLLHLVATIIHEEGRDTFYKFKYILECISFYFQKQELKNPVYIRH